MICSNCGKELKEGAKFCGYCGTKTEQKIENGQPRENISGNEQGNKKIIKISINKSIFIVLIVLLLILIISIGIILKKKKINTSIQPYDENNKNNIESNLPNYPLGLSEEDVKNINGMYNRINESGNIQEAFYFKEEQYYYFWVIYNKNNDILYCTVSYLGNISNAQVVKHYGSEKTFIGTFKEANTAILDGLRQRKDVYVLSFEQLKAIIKDLNINDESKNNSLEETQNINEQQNNNSETYKDSIISENTNNYYNYDSQYNTPNNTVEEYQKPVVSISGAVSNDDFGSISIEILRNDYDDELTVLVNNKKATRVDRKTYTFDYTLKPGNNIFDVSVTNKYGKTTNKKYPIEFEPYEPLVSLNRHDNNCGSLAVPDSIPKYNKLENLDLLITCNGKEGTIIGTQYSVEDEEGENIVVLTATNKYGKTYTTSYTYTK